VDAALVLVAVVAGLGGVVLGGLAFLPLFWIRTLPQPPIWIAGLALLLAYVAWTWFMSLRETRIEAFRPYAAEILKRRARRARQQQTEDAGSH
jgi:hypothetical protein